MAKTYPTEVLLSISTGILMCQFNDMHECIEYLCGGPVFTHQLAHRPFYDQLVAAVTTQHPDFEVSPAGINESNWKAFRDQQIARLGTSRELIPMAELMTARGDSFTEPLKGKQVIEVEVPK